MITLRNVTQAFGTIRAVDDVSLDVPEATTHVLLGSSGSGKSTILRMILGLVRPDAGEVEVAGVRVSEATRATVARQVGKTVLLVTHDVRAAMLLGATVTLLTGGRIVQHGTFADLVHRPASSFVTDFLRAQAAPSAMEVRA